MEINQPQLRQILSQRIFRKLLAHSFKFFDKDTHKWMKFLNPHCTRNLCAIVSDTRFMRCLTFIQRFRFLSIVCSSFMISDVDLNASLAGRKTLPALNSPPVQLCWRIHVGAEYNLHYLLFSFYFTSPPKLSLCFSVSQTCSVRTNTLWPV